MVAIAGRVPNSPTPAEWDDWITSGRSTTLDGMRAIRSFNVLAAGAALVVLAACSGESTDDGPVSVPEPSAESDTTTSPTPTPTPRATTAPTYAKKGVQARILPQMAGAVSAKPEAAGNAAWVVDATVQGASAGTEVELHAKSDGEWSVVDTATTDDKGRVGLTSTVPGRLHVVTGPEGNRTGARVSTDNSPEIVFADDFETNTVNTPDGLWHTRAQGHVGVRLCSEAVDEAAKVEDGVLRLSVLKDPNRGECTAVEGNPQYRLNGHVGTQDTFTFNYGYAAARVRFQADRGQHAAFWMQGGQEIDVVEYFGDNHPKGGLTSYVYNWAGPDQYETWGGGWVENHERYGDDWSSKYHTYSLEWTPETYTFRIDGKITHQLPGQPSNGPVYMIVSLLSSDYELKHSTKLPQHMDVDWVRAWAAD